MRALRNERGNALVTAVLVVAMMAGLGTAMVSIVDTQTSESRVQRSTDTTFNLAEGALNAEAFLLGRNWPQSTANMPTPAGAASPCSGQTTTGTLDVPAASPTPSLGDQVQSILAQTYTGSTTTTGAKWWLTACQDNGRNAWDASLLNGLAYDPTIASDPTPKPRRMWVRAEAKIDGRRRAVAALVQAGQQPVYPNLALVTGIIGGDLGNALTNLTNGPLLSSLLGALINQEPMFVGNVGLRCSLLDSASLLSCVSGVFSVTSALLPFLTANNYVHYTSDSVANDDQLAQLRQQAQQSGTYYPLTSAGAGTGPAGGACLPAGSAGKVVYIEQLGPTGTGSCTLNTAANPSARALIIGSGGVQVTGGGTFTGVINTLRGKAVAGDVADVRISGGSRVDGGVFADDNSALGAKAHGQVQVIVPPPTCVGLLNQVLCLLLGLVPFLGNVVTAILPQLSASLPAITYNATVVSAVTTFNDSAIVPGTFRQVTPMF
jgi:hypothetical protein